MSPARAAQTRSEIRGLLYLAAAIALTAGPNLVLAFLEDGDGHIRGFVAVMIVWTVNIAVFSWRRMVRGILMMFRTERGPEHMDRVHELAKGLIEQKWASSGTKVGRTAGTLFLSVDFGRKSVVFSGYLRDAAGVTYELTEREGRAFLFLFTGDGDPYQLSFSGVRISLTHRPAEMSRHERMGLIDAAEEIMTAADALWRD